MAEAGVAVVTGAGSGLGREIGRVTPNGTGWRDLPPGTEPGEQTLPRAGTNFQSTLR